MHQRSSVLLFSLLASLATAQQFVAELDTAAPTVSTIDARLVIPGSNRVWFQARPQDTGAELFVSDGTIGGTGLVLDFFAGPTGSDIRPIHETGGKLLCYVRNPVNDGNEIWVYDVATGSATFLVDGVLTPYFVAQLGNQVWFAQPGGTFGGEVLWFTDLTPAGTLNAGGVNRILGVANLGQQLVFAFRNNSRTEDSWWATDGIGWTQLTTFSAGTFSSNVVEHNGAVYGVILSGGVESLWRTNGTQAGTFAVTPLGSNQVSDRSRIASNGARLVTSGGNALWSSDGTAPGTTQILPSVLSIRMASAGGLVFFDGPGGNLWRTDGSVAGTFALTTIGGGVTFLKPAGSRMYCTNLNLTSLIGSDGTVAGTSVLSLAPSSIGSMAAIGSNVAITGSIGTDLWISDATVGGSMPLTSNVTLAGIEQSTGSAAVGETLVFLADTPSDGREAWRTDGSLAGTRKLVDLAPGAADGAEGMAHLRGAAFFTGAGQLWRSDGTTAGTVAVAPIGQFVGPMRGDRDFLLFSVFVNGAHRIMRSDGTTAGTGVMYTPTARLDDYLQFGGRSWIATANGLYVYDGASVQTLTFTVGALYGGLGDEVAFLGSSNTLCMTNGTGVRAVGTLGPNFLLPHRAVVGDGFVVIVDVLGRARGSDGTSIHTLPVPRVSSLVAAGGAVYLVAEFNHRSALYRTDGTAAGTVLAVSFGGGSGVVGAEAIGSGDRLLLQVDDGTSGLEPWISDGTQAGTFRLADLDPSGSSAPDLLGVAGTRAFLAADDGSAAGRELWSFDLGAVGAPHVQSHGDACLGALGRPWLAASGQPNAGATIPFVLDLDRAAPSSLVLWFVGGGLGNVGVGPGCAFYPSTVYFSVITFSDGAGLAHLTMAMPADPLLVGQQFVNQAAIADPLGASFFGVSGSQALLFVIGN